MASSARAERRASRDDDRGARRARRVAGLARTPVAGLLGAAATLAAGLPGAAAPLAAAAVPSASAPVGAAGVPAATAAGAAVAPRAAPPDRADTLPDPEAAVDGARDRQRGFERHRRRRLPYDGLGRADRCDEIVGRYCLWHDDGNGDRDDPPDEAESVRREREGLLEQLASAVEAAPASDWLIGQRVRYLLDAGRREAALQAALGCRAETWWCRALEGRVLHASGRFVEAADAFRAAVGGMGPEQRREWSDVSVLLEGDAAGRWDDLGPRGRRAMARRLWRLADPLYLVPGNDRRTEHLARRVEVRLRRDAATPFGRFWTDGLGELTLRYGLPVEYRREPPSPSRIDPKPSVVGRHPPDALSFLPSAEALLAPGDAGPDGWRLDARRPHASYAAPYADTIRGLEHRLAVFPRGDTSVVVAAYRSEPATADDAGAPDGRPEPPGGGDDAPAAREDDGGEREPGRPEALLRLVPVAALDSPSVSAAASEHRRTGELGGGLAVRVPSRPHLLGLEVLQPSASVADRERHAVGLPLRPEGVPGLSDLLLLEPDAAVERPLEELLPAVRPPGPVRPGSELGVYWELYGPRLLLEDVGVSVALVEEGGGFVDRIAGAFGFGEEEGVALEWRDAASRPGRVHPRGVRLRLPDDLPEGEYDVRVTVEVPGREAMSAVRRVEVSGGERD